MKADVQAKDGELAKLRSDIAKHINAAEKGQWQDLYNQARAQAKDFKEKLSAEGETHDALRAQISTLTTQLNKGQAQVRALQQKCAASEKEKDDIQRDFAATELRQDAQILRLSECTSAAAAARDTAEQRIRKLEGEAAEWRNQVSGKRIAVLGKERDANLENQKTVLPQAETNESAPQVSTPEPRKRHRSAESTDDSGPRSDLSQIFFEFAEKSRDLHLVPPEMRDRGSLWLERLVEVMVPILQHVKRKHQAALRVNLRANVRDFVKNAPLDLWHCLLVIFEHGSTANPAPRRMCSIHRSCVFAKVMVSGGERLLDFQK